MQTIKINTINSKIPLANTGLYECKCVVQIDENNSETRTYYLSEQQINKALKEKELII